MTAAASETLPSDKQRVDDNHRTSRQVDDEHACGRFTPVKRVAVDQRIDAVVAEDGNRRQDDPVETGERRSDDERDYEMTRLTHRLG